MSAKERARAKFLEGLAQRIAGHLVRHPLLLADGFLDEARRFFLTVQFSGNSEESVKEVLQSPGESVGLSGFYIGLSIDEMMRTEHSVRLALWSAHFATMKETRFGASFASAMEEAGRYDQSPESPPESRH